MSVIYDRDNNCSSSVHLQLRLISLMLLKTTCSFHGNDSRCVSGVGWLWAGDCRQSGENNSGLPLLSARPAVTFPAAEHHRPLAGTKLYCLVTEAHRCEQLAKGCYAAFAPSRICTHYLMIASPMLYPLCHCAIYSPLVPKFRENICLHFVYHLTSQETNKKLWCTAKPSVNLPGILLF